VAYVQVRLMVEILRYITLMLGERLETIDVLLAVMKISFADGNDCMSIDRGCF